MYLCHYIPTGSLLKLDVSTNEQVYMDLVQVGLLAGIILCAVLGASFHSLAPLFTKDPQVLEILRKGVLVSYAVSF